MRVAILRRESRGVVVVRVLECGHEQREVGGGVASTAIFALCHRKHATLTAEVTPQRKGAQRR